jgi:hypothetical protein
MYPSDRASHAFKTGYWAARDGRLAFNPHVAGTCAHYDWLDGYSAFLAETRAAARIARRNAGSFKPCLYATDNTYEE